MKQQTNWCSSWWLWGVLCLLLSCGAHAQPPRDAKIEGTWSPLPSLALPGRTGAAPPGAWRVQDKELSCVVDAGQTGTWRVARTGPLPDGDWTLDLMLSAPFRSGLEFLLEVGERSVQQGPSSGSWRVKWEPDSEESGVQVYTYGQGNEGNLGQRMSGATHWLRFAYDAGARRLSGWMNGKALRGTATGIALARSPITLSAVCDSPHKEAQKLRLSLFRVQPTLPAAAHSPGTASGTASEMAYRGWRRASPRQALVPAELIASLESMAQGTDEPETKGIALAALVVAEWMAQGEANGAQWQRATNFVEKSLEVDRRALSFLTPIAAASADEKGREQARRWAHIFFDGSPENLENDSTEQAGLIRMSACDPARATTLLLKRGVPFHMAFLLANDLKESDPALALALYGNLNANAAWLLPELQKVAPLHANTIIERLLDGQAAHGQSSAGRDLTFAAYRLASHDLPLAVTLLERIDKPLARVETLRFMGEALRLAPVAKPDPQSEAALRRMIELWQPSENDDSPVPLWAQLAVWQAAAGQKEAAQETLRQAAGKSGKLPQTRFRDTWAIARVAVQGQLPDAALWWDKAKEIVSDPELNPYGAYGEQAPVAVITRDLLREAGFKASRERLLELLRGLPPRADAQSAWQALLEAALREDPSQVAALLEAMPEEQRAQVARIVARRLMFKDALAARAFVEQLSPPLATSLRPSLEASPLGTEKLLAEEISALLKNMRPGVRPAWSGDSVLGRAGRLSFKELSDLEPIFVTHRGVYARLCLGAVISAAGLQEEPVWQRFRDAESDRGWSIPWGVSSLADAVRSERDNRERRN